jgi:hypothetical protein
LSPIVNDHRPIGAGILVLIHADVRVIGQDSALEAVVRSGVVCNEPVETLLGIRSSSISDIPEDSEADAPFIDKASSGWNCVPYIDGTRPIVVYATFGHFGIVQPHRMHAREEFFHPVDEQDLSRLV